MIAAGAIVASDVAPHALVVGCPARQIGWVCACGRRLTSQADLWHCETCGRGYVVADTSMAELT
jgi:UDP-2-acetamido-3-amino-2,3-dideoxy-glucuronate N-acetyltransferase